MHVFSLVHWQYRIVRSSAFCISSPQGCDHFGVDEVEKILDTRKVKRPIQDLCAAIRMMRQFCDQGYRPTEDSSPVKSRSAASRCISSQRCRAWRGSLLTSTLIVPLATFQRARQCGWRGAPRHAEKSLAGIRQWQCGGGWLCKQATGIPNAFNIYLLINSRRFSVERRTNPRLTRCCLFELVEVWFRKARPTALPRWLLWFSRCSQGQSAPLQRRQKRPHTIQSSKLFRCLVHRWTSYVVNLQCALIIGQIAADPCQRKCDKSGTLQELSVM
jgi:hypothetical protein